MTRYGSWLPVAAAVLLGGCLRRSAMWLMPSPNRPPRRSVDGSILPFPPMPSASTAGPDDGRLDLQEAGRAAAALRGCAEHSHHPDGRRRAGDAVDLWRRDQYADARPHREDGGVLQPLPFHRHVLADAGGAAHRPQPHAGRQWPDRGDRQRLRRLQRYDPEVGGDGRRGAEGLRLQHRRLGQVAQYAGGADHLQGPVRLLADRLRLRIFLRVPRRRGLAVRADPGPQHHAGDRAPARGLSPHRRHRDRRHPLAPRAERLRAGQAVLHVLGAGRVAWPAPDHEGVGRQV